jgi:hypothetical protein
MKLHCQSSDLVTAIAFYLMQNFLMSYMTMRKVFILGRWGTHNFGTCEAVTYTYHESEGTDGGQNDVTSVLVEYLKNSLVADTSELWLFCDG